MNRQIKFRGKRPDTGKWVFGILAILEEESAIMVEEDGVFNDGSASPFFAKWDFVDRETVGQFTGLLDKNGKEIYEGDILRCIGQRTDNAGKIYYREVTFKKGSFCMYCADIDIHIHSPISSHIVNGILGWDVCGNIHDTPELLISQGTKEI